MGYAGDILKNISNLSPNTLKSSAVIIENVIASKNVQIKALKAKNQRIETKLQKSEVSFNEMYEKLKLVMNIPEGTESTLKVKFIIITIHILHRVPYK